MTDRNPAQPLQRGFLPRIAPVPPPSTQLGVQVMELIRSEMKSRGTAAVVVTHDERITEFCDRTVHIIDRVLAA